MPQGQGGHARLLQSAPGLAVVALLAQRLPVSFVPEEPRIAPMRQNMVNHRRGRQHTALQANGALGDCPPENACGLSASPRHIRALRRCPASVPERCIHNSFAPFKLAPGIGKYFAIFHFEYHIRLTDYFAIVGHHENRFFTSEGLHERQHFIP